MLCDEKQVVGIVGVPPTPEDLMRWENERRDHVLNNTPFPEEEDGVFTLKDPVNDPNEFQLTRFEADDLRDVQVPMISRKLSPIEAEEMDGIKRNAAKACAKCPGHCCLALVLSWSPERTQEMLDEKIKQSQGMALEMAAQDFGEDSARVASDILNDIYDGHFILKNFQLMRKNSERSYTYTCKQFDPVARRCNAYDRRPTMCRRFICGAATAGVPPTGRYMETKEHPEIMALIRAQDIYDPNFDFGTDKPCPDSTATTPSDTAPTSSLSSNDCSKSLAIER